MLAVPLGGPASAQSCDDDTIDAVANDGSMIRMRSGSAFRVDSSDRIDASLWSSLDDVLVCKDETEIVNKDKDGERVAVRRLRR
jgi:hypothetical protein